MTEPIPCKFCRHDYDAHNLDAADRQRNMPCTECPDGICRAPGQTLPENPAETMRRTAQLMRERAEAAPRGPWTMKRGHLGGHPQYVSDADGTTVAECWESAETAPAASVHIASWHPAVALAVADWLGAVADNAALELALDTPECVHDESCRCERIPAWGCNRCAGWFGGDCHCWDDPLAAARAYLDGTEPTP